MVLGKLHVEQEYLLAEAEKEIAERTHSLDKNKASCQGLSDDLQQLEFNANSVEIVIVSAREAIVRAQALLKTNEQILALKKKKMEKLEATRNKVQLELNAESFELEILRAKLVARKLLTEEELRDKAMAEVEETHQRDIQELRKQIKSLTERD